MITQHFDLPGSGQATLDAYLHESYSELPRWTKRPAVVVCPGGGYWYCSPREADPIAFSYLGAGFHTFVLRYSVGEAAAFPAPLCELSAAMKLIRDHAEEWGVVSDQIAVCGFSAGGHLAASLGTLWNLPEVARRSGAEQGENRPNALILGYPVITTSWMERDGSLDRIIGDRGREETLRLLNCQNQVGEHTPPTFLTHTFADNAVPVEDSLAFAAALTAQNIPFELHIFPNGEHGLSLATLQTATHPGGVDADFAQWMDLSIRWLRRLFGDQPEHDPGRRATSSATGRSVIAL